MRGGRKRTLLKALVAIAAAYALAMQALLGAILLSQEPAGADPFVICLSSNDGAAPAHGPPKSSAHDHCVLCTFVASHAILGGGSAAVAPYPAYSPVVRAPAIARTVVYESPTGQHPRGPPASRFA
jgi:hypothetical protein